jgi:hypothetical protein
MHPSKLIPSLAILGIALLAVTFAWAQTPVGPQGATTHDLARFAGPWVAHGAGLRVDLRTRMAYLDERTYTWCGPRVSAPCDQINGRFRPLSISLSQPLTMFSAAASRHGTQLVGAVQSQVTVMVVGAGPAGGVAVGAACTVVANGAGVMMAQPNRPHRSTGVTVDVGVPVVDVGVPVGVPVTSAGGVGVVRPCPNPSRDAAPAGGGASRPIPIAPMAPSRITHRCSLRMLRSSRGYTAVSMEPA